MVIKKLEGVFYMKRLLALMTAIILSAAFAGCGAQDNQNEQGMGQIPKEEEEQVMEQEMEEKEAVQTARKNWLTLVVAFEGYNEMEYNGVKKAFDGSEYRLVTVSTQKGQAKGMSEGAITIEKTIDEVDDPGLGIVVVGGSGSVGLWENEDLIKIIREVDMQGGLVASICAAPGVLVNAGVLDGKTASWYRSDDLDALMEGVECSNSGEDVWIQGNIITGNGPPAGDEFGAAVFHYVTTM